MNGKRSAHHRAINRTGPHHSWLQRKSYHLAKVYRPGFVGMRILGQARAVRAGVYEIPPALMLEFRRAVEDFRPYAADVEGAIWQ